MLCDMIGKNNLFNIRYNARNNWIGQTGSTRGFCDFLLIDYAIRAICVLILRSYRKKNILTISEIIHRFAPSSDANDTDAYILFICCRLSFLPFDIPRSLLEYAHLICIIAWYETNYKLEPSTVLRVMTEFKIKPYKMNKI